MDVNLSRRPTRANDETLTIPIPNRYADPNAHLRYAAMWLLMACDDTAPGAALRLADAIAHMKNQLCPKES